MVPARGNELGLSAPAQTGKAIPKNLFHIAKDSQSIAPALQENLARLAAINPDWTQQVFYDDKASDWVRAQFPGRISNAFHQISPRYGVCKADFLRCLLIWHYGGVYLDLKSSAKHPFSQILRPTDEYLIARLRNARKWRELKECSKGEEFQQWFIAARPGHPFLAAVIAKITENIETYRPLDYALGARAVVKLTGPIAYTLAIAPNLATHPHREIDAIAEGWLYTVLPDTKAHRILNPEGHYGKKVALHVLPPSKWQMSFWLETLGFHLINSVRRVIRPLNHLRLERRRQRKERKAAQSKG